MSKLYLEIRARFVYDAGVDQPPPPRVSRSVAAGSKQQRATDAAVRPASAAESERLRAGRHCETDRNRAARLLSAAAARPANLLRAVARGA